MQIRHILCPTDFSDESRSALAYAAGLARSMGASMELLHVYHTPAYSMDAEAPTGLEDLTEETRRQLNERLEVFVRQQQLNDVKVTHSVAVGIPHVAIDEAAQKGADLVVMGTLGRTGLRRLLLGSVAERVVRTCPKPVITVHPDWRADRQGAARDGSSSVP